MDYCIPDVPASSYAALTNPPEHRGRKNTAKVYTWFDRSHPSTYLHHKVGSAFALDIHRQMEGAHPHVPAKIDLRARASAADVVTAWVEAGGKRLPGYGDGKGVDEMVARGEWGEVRVCQN